MKYLNIKTEIVRDSINVTKSVNVIIELHINPIQIPHIFTDENGVEQSVMYEKYTDASLVTTRSCVYDIPEDSQTDLLVGFHPHNTENEHTYQALYSGWWADIEKMEDYKTKYLELINL